MALTVNLDDMRELVVGSATTFRQSINYNFSLFKEAVDEMQTQVDEMQTKVDTMGTQIEQIIAGGAGIDIKVQANQPTDQKPGDFWYKILS